MTPCTISIQLQKLAAMSWKVTIFFSLPVRTLNLLAQITHSPQVFIKHAHHLQIVLIDIYTAGSMQDWHDANQNRIVLPFSLHCGPRVLLSIDDRMQVFVGITYLCSLKDGTAHSQWFRSGQFRDCFLNEFPTAMSQTLIHY
jgi:hypothetical protein